MKPLANRVAVVTGASRGIGRAVAERLARDGARVVAAYRRGAAETGEVVAGICTAGGEAFAVQADLGQPDQIERLFRQAVARFGRVEILVNNAGVYGRGTLDEADPATFAAVFDVNVRGALLAAHHAARTMGEGGRIINISSGAARAAVPGAGVYAASKAALEAFTRCHAAELGPRGITVNAVAPGFTETEMARTAAPPEVLALMARNTALGRLGRPDDIADVVAFLASPEARWITGEVIGASGGLRAG